MSGYSLKRVGDAEKYGLAVWAVFQGGWQVWPAKGEQATATQMDCQRWIARQEEQASVAERQEALTWAADGARASMLQHGHTPHDVVQDAADPWHRWVVCRSCGARVDIASQRDRTILLGEVNPCKKRSA
jgi:hypothetical protein